MKWNHCALPGYSLGVSLGQLSNVDSKFDAGFYISASFCYDVTMKSIAILRNSSGYTEKGHELKIVSFSWILHLSTVFVCTIHFYD